MLRATMLGVRRTGAALLLGIMLGVAGTLIGVEIAGGWYTYFTMPDDRCHSTPMHTEVAPNQPNPCLFRERRWSFI